jgi:hypothetical protein
MNVLEILNNISNKLSISVHQTPAEATVDELI